MRYRHTLGLLTATAMLLSPTVADAKLVVGVSDQQPTTFQDPFYKQAKFTVARYIIPYDVTTDPFQTQRWEPWLANAKAAKQRILVSFEHSRKSRTAAGKLPSATEYKKALAAFKKKYGKDVTDISPWNEVNRKFDKRRGEGQPTWNRPDKAAMYYGIAKKVFPKNKIVALDVLDENKVGPTVKYIKAFKKAVAKQRLPKVKIWGLHPYSDINRFSTSRTRAMLKATGPGEIWLTEASGLVQFGSNFPYNEKRAAAANKCMFTIAKLSKSIKRLYFYGWVAGGAFDPALIGTDGKPRPGYKVVQKRQAGPCKKPKS
jgi:hypothetical protein